jgi:hypothetical protein
MRVTVYDRRPGAGFAQKFLVACWFVGCWLQKVLGKVDAYYGAESWEAAFSWLLQCQGALTSLQYWGHGSPGHVWLAGVDIPSKYLEVLRSKTTAETVIWFRTCSTFQGLLGFDFSKRWADSLKCTVAGHTRIIGPLQGGLHTRRPDSEPSWPVSEGELPKSWLPCYWRWGNNTITCLGTKIPKGW